MKIDSLIDENECEYPFYGQSTRNNGITSYNRLTSNVLNNKKGKPTILIDSNNQNIVYLETPFYLKDGHGSTSVLQSDNLNRVNQMFIIASIDRVIKQKFSYNKKATKIELKNTIIKLPVKNGKIDYDFMERIVLELEHERISQLYTYLIDNGLADCTISEKELVALQHFENISWREYNLKYLFGKAIRGKRLKSADRIHGDLPFVTEGETDEGISPFIGNKVDVFESNTTTIDMFGSAKYRNYKYGADDHIAVVNTNKLDKFASIFITTCIHKASFTGKFNYGRNFYAKDADELIITLPTKASHPDYDFMKLIISTIHKIVMKEAIRKIEEKVGFGIE